MNNRYNLIPMTEVDMRKVVQQPLKTTLEIVDNATRIFYVKDNNELEVLTNDYIEMLTSGNIAIMPNKYSGKTKIFVWIDKNVKWQNIILDENVYLDHTGKIPVNLLPEDNSKSIVFVINDSVSNGVQPLEFKFPNQGKISSILATCSGIGTYDFEVAIEKTNETNYEQDTGWTNVLSRNVCIKQGKKSNKNNDPDYAISNSVVEKNDVFRLNVINNGGIKHLIVTITIQ